MPCLSLLLESREGMMAATENQRKSPPSVSSDVTSPETMNRTTTSPQRGEEDMFPSTTTKQGDEHGPTRSAFEITSVSHVAEENEEGESNQTHASKDQDEIQNSLNISNRDSNRFSTSSGDSDELPKEELPVFSSDKNKTFIMEDTIIPNPSPKPTEVAIATTAAAVNGPAQQPPSRFRRVNQYIRGRWLVRDTFEQERPESEMRMASLPKSTEGMTSQQSISPLVARKHDTMEQQNVGSDTESNTIPTQDAMALNDKQSVVGCIAESIHSLSRTASMSSVIKSVDEDERDTESVVSVTTRTPDFQPIATNTTMDNRSCQCEECTLK